MWIFEYYYSLFAAALAYFDTQSEHIRPARFGTRVKSLGRYIARTRIRLRLLLAALCYHASHTVLCTLCGQEATSAAASSSLPETISVPNTDHARLHAAFVPCKPNRFIINGYACTRYQASSTFSRTGCARMGKVMRIQYNRPTGSQSGNQQYVRAGAIGRRTPGSGM